MAPIGAKLGQNTFHTIPNVSFFDAKKIKKIENIRKLWTAVYPSRMAPIGAKLGQNAFQTIPDISFFDAQKFLLMIFFQKKSASFFFDELPFFENLE